MLANSTVYVANDYCTLIYTRIVYMFFSSTAPKRIYKGTETQEDDTQIDEMTLRQFLGGGEITVRHVRCIIVGCAKAGKTTLLKRLQNFSYEELIKTDRTEMVDVHVNSFEVIEEENTIQSKLSFSHF